MNQAADTGPYKIWHDVLADPRFAPSSEAIQEYLKLTDGIESPTPYNIWSFISLMAALCGSRVALTNGPMGHMPLNLGIVFTGVPALKKSTAMTIMQKFAEGLPISYGPTDSAGQRQGLMSAMMPRWQKDSMDEFATNLSAETLEQLSELDSTQIVAKLPDPLNRPASELYFVAKELGRLLRSSSTELLDFFNDAIDRESIHYRIKNQEIRIPKPLINLIGATTPTSLGEIMPRGASEHGILSRFIFVHAAHLSRSVPIPERWSDDQQHIRSRLHERMCQVLEFNHDEIGLTPAARSTYQDLYLYQPVTVDVRLSAYAGRRGGHMLRVAALLAILRGQTPVTVQASDVRLAHALLVLTETEMDKSFYGLDKSPYSRVLCAAVDIIEGSADGQGSTAEIQEYASHLGTREQISTFLISLSEQGKIIAVPGAGSQSNTVWRLSTERKEAALLMLRGAFRLGGIPEADEYKTHKQIAVIKKGSSG